MSGDEEEEEEEKSQVKKRGTVSDSDQLLDSTETTVGTTTVGLFISLAPSTSHVLQHHHQPVVSQLLFTLLQQQLQQECVCPVCIAVAPLPLLPLLLLSEAAAASEVASPLQCPSHSCEDFLGGKGGDGGGGGGGADCGGNKKSGPSTQATVQMRGKRRTLWLKPLQQWQYTLCPS